MSTSNINIIHVVSLGFDKRCKVWVWRQTKVICQHENILSQLAIVSANKANQVPPNRLISSSPSNPCFSFSNKALLLSRLYRSGSGDTHTRLLSAGWVGVRRVLSSCAMQDKTCRRVRSKLRNNDELPKYLFSDRELE